MGEAELMRGLQALAQEGRRDDVELLTFTKARVVKVHEQAGTAQADRTPYAVDVQVLTRDGAADPRWPVIPEVELPVGWAARGGRGVYALPEVGTVVRLGFYYRDPSYPFVDAVLGDGTAVPRHPAGSATVQLQPGVRVAIRPDGSVVLEGATLKSVTMGGSDHVVGNRRADVGDTATVTTGRDQVRRAGGTMRDEARKRKVSISGESTEGYGKRTVTVRGAQTEKLGTVDRIVSGPERVKTLGGRRDGVVGPLEQVLGERWDVVVGNLAAHPTAVRIMAVTGNISIDTVLGQVLMGGEAAVGSPGTNAPAVLAAFTGLSDLFIKYAANFGSNGGGPLVLNPAMMIELAEWLLALALPIPTGGLSSTKVAVAP